MISNDKMLGVIFGQAVGDALGLGAEFLNKSEVVKYYPNGLNSYEQIIQDRHRKRWHKGAWTDDTDQMLCIAKAIIKDKGINPQSVAKEFYAWLNNRPMGIGQNTIKVLTQPHYVDNPEQAAKLIWERSGKQSAANGALMRTSILGLFGSNLKENAENISKLTHYDPRCIGSCVILDTLINHLINDTTLSPDEIIAIGNGYDSRINEYIVLSQNKDISCLELDKEPGIGYTLRTLSAGLWTYFNAKTFEDGLLQVVNEGGDADTNGAVAGSILGAKFGYSMIPEKYIKGLYHYDELKEIAEKIITLANNEGE
jgi:ADP-ribosylglycohydrolase